MGNVSAAVVAVISGIIGLAIVAVLVSKQAQTPTVISSTGTALSQIIGAAVGPVTGQTTNAFGTAGSLLGGLA
jgi:preprotein translocase subunit SecD